MQLVVRERQAVTQRLGAVVVKGLAGQQGGRMLNKKVAMSRKVAAYGDEFGAWAMVFHHRLIAFLDVNGCCRADPYWLKAAVMARISGILPEDHRKFSVGLVKHGLAILYEVDGMLYLHMPGFRDELVGLWPDKEAPEFPTPQEGKRLSVQLPDDGRKAYGTVPHARGHQHR